MSLSANAKNILTAVISGGVVSALLTFAVDWKKQDASELMSVVQLYKEQVEKFEVKNEILSKRVEENEEEIFVMRQMRSSQMSLPFPWWFKDVSGRMIACNLSYESAFLAPHGIKSKDYIGTFDKDIWGEELGRKYQANDRLVMIRKRTIKFNENVKNSDGKLEKWSILKYPVISGKVVIGVAGVAIPTTESQFERILH